jgi:hypothetical protein
MNQLIIRITAIFMIMVFLWTCSLSTTKTIYFTSRNYKKIDRQPFIDVLTVDGKAFRLIYPRFEDNKLTGRRSNGEQFEINVNRIQTISADVREIKWGFIAIYGLALVSMILVFLLWDPMDEFGRGFEKLF